MGTRIRSEKSYVSSFVIDKAKANTSANTNTNTSANALGLGA